MKRFLRIIILALLINISFVKAADFSTSATGNTTIASGGTITVTFKANSSKGLYGINGVLNYDTSKLELTSKQGSSGFVLTLGSKAVLDSASPSPTNKAFTFMILKFKAKSTFKIGESTSISLSNVTGSDGSRTLSGTSSKLTVKVASTDNNLSNLTVDSKTVNGFKSSTLSYKMTVENSVTKVTIGATASDSSAKISGTGTKKLSIYNNTFRVVVKSAAGTTRTYTIVIVRKDANGYAGARSSDSKLKSLSIEGYELDFKPDSKEYELSVKNEVSSLTINAVPNDSNAKVEIKNDPLVVGLNKIVITVTAEDESKSEYVINVTRNNENPAVKIEQFKETAESTTKDTIEVLVDSDQIITTEQLKMIKSSNKNVIFAHYEEGKLIYAWHILNKDIKVDKDFNTKVEFTSKKEKNINKLTNFAEAFYISGPNENTSNAKLKVLTNLKEDTRLYYYDGSIRLQEERLKVDEDSYVEFAFKNNDYFLSRMENHKNISGLAIILGVENLIIAGFCVYLIIKKSKEKRELGGEV